MSEIYIVEYSTGSYDDYSERQVFVTKNEDIAKKWVDKFNQLILKWQGILGELYNFDDEDGSFELFERFPILDRYWTISEINSARYYKIEIRYSWKHRHNRSLGIG